MDLEVEVSFEELEKFLENATNILSKDVKIDGFRSGKIPFDVLKQHVGEMAIYEKAANIAVSKTYPGIVKEENLETVGPPQVSIVKLAPKNPLVYKASVPLLPHITLCDYKKLSVKKKEAKVDDKMLENTLKDLQKMQKKEKLVKRAAKKEDKVAVDMDLFLDNVPVEGGQTKNYAIFLNEAHYIPGFAEELVGAKEGETKEFTLPFPEDYFQKNLAGQKVKFKVKIISVFELELPELNDEFAKALGQKNIEDLKKTLADNIKKDLEQKENVRVENELLKKIAEESKFEDIPELLVQSETHKMIHELQDGVTRKGLDFKTYLENLKKTEEDLAKDFAPQAVERIKSALIIKEIAIKEKVEADEAEVKEEVSKFSEIYKNDPTVLERIKSKETEDYLKNVVVNRKTLALLNKMIVK